MNLPSAHDIRRVCTAGRLLASGGLVISAAIMLRVGGDPSTLSTGVAIALLATIFLAFLADRFLASILDRVDRYDARAASPAPLADRADLRDAA